MQNQAIKNCIEAWSLNDVKGVPDVFGECLIEEYLGGNIPDNKAGKIPEGQFNARMFEWLIKVSSDFKTGVITIEQAVDTVIKIITDPQNYS
jgi:hypothetical protein